MRSFRYGDLMQMKVDNQMSWRWRLDGCRTFVDFIVDEPTVFDESTLGHAVT